MIYFLNINPANVKEYFDVFILIINIILLIETCSYIITM